MVTLKIKGKIYKVKERRTGILKYTFLTSWSYESNKINITFIPIEDFPVYPSFMPITGKEYCRKKYKYVNDISCSVNDVLKIELAGGYKIEL